MVTKTHRTHRDVDPATQARIDAIATTGDLEPPPVPRRPTLNGLASLRDRLRALNRFIVSFEYNHTGYYVMKRDRGLKHVMFTAKEIMREALPIQCVEAVFLGIHLTAEMDVERIPISFKSKAGGQSYRHIVLAVQDEGRWGALGISRRKSLQHKDPLFESLSELVQEYRTSYEHCGHSLVKVYFGLPLPLGAHSNEPVKWRAFRLRLDQGDWKDHADKIDKYAKDGGWLREYFARAGKLPEPYGKAPAAPAESPTKQRKASLPPAAAGVRERPAAAGRRTPKKRTPKKKKPKADGEETEPDSAPATPTPEARPETAAAAEDPGEYTSDSDAEDV